MLPIGQPMKLSYCQQAESSKTVYLEHEVGWGVDDNIIRVSCILLKLCWHTLLCLHAPWYRLKQDAGVSQFCAFRLSCFLYHLGAGVTTSACGKLLQKQQPSEESEGFQIYYE